MTTFIPLRTVAQMLNAGGSTMFGKGIRARDVMARFHDLTDHQRANVANWCIRQGADPVPTLYPVGCVITDDAVYADGCTINARRVCDCADPGCPSCYGWCQREPVLTVYRVDMDDCTGTVMCCDCARDALDSGVYGTVEIASDETLFAHRTA